MVLKATAFRADDAADDVYADDAYTDHEHDQGEHDDVAYEGEAGEVIPILGVGPGTGPRAPILARGRPRDRAQGLGPPGPGRGLRAPILARGRPRDRAKGLPGPWRVPNCRDQGLIPESQNLARSAFLFPFPS